MRLMRPPEALNICGSSHPPILITTNGIQVRDLVARKLPQDGGRHWRALLEELEQVCPLLSGDKRLSGLASPLATASQGLRSSIDWLLGDGRSADDVASGALPFLRQFALTVCGYLLARQAAVAVERQDRDGDSNFLAAKLVTARFFMEQILPQTVGPAAQACGGSELLYAIPA